VFQGLDSWIVLFVVGALVLFSVAFLRNRRQRGTAIACVALAASALALCIFESVDAAGRVVELDGVAPPVEPGHPGVQLQGIPPPVYTDFGFYLFLVSSIVAVRAAVGVLLSMRGNRTPEPTTVAVAVR
jgi:ABC-type Mn2+/Zn2+ transport system permease subunit